MDLHDKNATIAELKELARQINEYQHQDIESLPVLYRADKIEKNEIDG